MGPDKKLCIALSDFLQNKCVAGFGDELEVIKRH
jgi:hypothetical protein